MKKTALLAIMIAGACIQGADNGGWVKKVTNGVSSTFYTCGNCISSGTSWTTYQYFVNHKLVATISKDDDLYKLSSWKGDLIGVYDDLAIAKSEGAKLDK